MKKSDNRPRFSGALMIGGCILLTGIGTAAAQTPAPVAIAAPAPVADQPTQPLKQPASAATAAKDAAPAPAPIVKAASPEPEGQISQGEQAIIDNTAILNSFAIPEDEAAKKESKKETKTAQKETKAVKKTAQKETKTAKVAPAPKVEEILADEANVRPWPSKYLIVKKDHAADDTDSRLAAARLALSRGHYQAALQFFNDLYRENPMDERVSMGRAVALQKLGQVDEALAAYETTLAKNPKNIEALTNMMGLLQEQDPNRALEKLSQLRNLYPANADVTAQLGTVYGKNGDYDKALRYLDMADALNPGNASILYNRAVVYDHLGKMSQAADLYRQVITHAGDGSQNQGVPVETVKRRLAELR